MDPTLLHQLFGWTAYLSAVATIGTAVTIILFFTVGGRFGKINDAVSVAQMLLMLPVAAGLFLVTRPGGAVLALLAMAIGMASMLVAAALQALLVVGRVKYEQTISAVLTAGGAIGLWLALANVLALVAGTMPRGLAALGIAADVGYICGALGFQLGGQGHPLSYIGGALGLLGYSAWAIWLGRLFLLGKLILAG